MNILVLFLHNKNTFISKGGINMAQTNLTFASLTESELQALKDAEKFLNNQPDHRKERPEGKEIVLLAYLYGNKEQKL
jgi:hypothetical protein